MDKSNFVDVIRMARNDQDRMKVKLILEELYPGQSKEVPDPYFDERQGFEKVFAMLDAACDKIVNKLSNER
jgi:protein-tyrosine phosphatase